MSCTIKQLVASVVLVAGVASQFAFAQGRLELEIHIDTGNNIAISTGETTAGQSDSKDILNGSHDGAAYAGSIIADLSICKDHAVLVNMTRDNLAVGGTVAGSIVMTDAGIEGMHTGKPKGK